MPVDESVVEAALDMARREARLLETMQEALSSADDATALTYARVLCDLEREPPRKRRSQRRRPSRPQEVTCKEDSTPPTVLWKWPKLSGAVLDGLIEAALEISRKRDQLKERMKGALIGGDDATALQFARRLCGLEEHAVGNRPRAGQTRRKRSL